MSFRLAVLWQARLNRTDRYRQHASGLEFYRLDSTGLSTLSLWTDLVASYLATPDFRDCGDAAPASQPVCDKRRTWRGPGYPCAYRDGEFCMSLDKATGALRAPYERAFSGFYGGHPDKPEASTWALSNVVNLSAADSELGDDPALLFNTAATLFSQGELETADHYLEETARVLPGRLSTEEINRATRLRVIAKLLRGSALPTDVHCAGPGAEGKVRTRFRELYGDPAGEAPAFIPVGGCFPAKEDAELIDNWLFIHRWRGLLKESRFEDFVSEFDRLDREPRGVFMDFFRLWRSEIAMTLGRRALDKMREHERNKEHDKASLIRRFLSEAPFPSPIRDDVRKGEPWITVRHAALVALPALFALGILVFGSLWIVRFRRHYRDVFESRHWRDRMRHTSRELRSKA